MNLLKKDRLNLIVENSFEYTFEIQESGLYFIEVIASAKSWWQNFKTLKSFFKDDDLAVKIDNIEFPKLNSKKGFKEFDQELNFESGLHYIELWADGIPAISNLRILLEKDDKNQVDEWLRKWKELKQYNYKGLNGEENYNRYDAQIIEAVAFWNKEFFSQDCPPDEPLDPNLIKAMIFQESRVGYDEKNNGNINVMQVGNSGDPSLKVLNNQTENPENEMINGKLWKVDYEGMAKVENIYDSIYWGVRWLYHRAQKIRDDGGRYWFSWKDAANRYGHGTNEYINNIWKIYTEGVDERVQPTIKLWAISFLFIISLSAFFLSNNIFASQSIESAILDTINDPHEKDYIQNVQVSYYKNNNPLFLTIIATQKDWSERFEIGNYINEKVGWIKISEYPTEQSILSAKFLDLVGFNNPIVEVYGQTHAGHGSYYFYEIKDGEANLLLNTQAVDINSDTRWAPDNMKKYGYGSCGEVFFRRKIEK